MGRKREKGTLSLGQAAELANLSKRAFMETLANYEISVFNFNPEEIEIICRAIYEHRNISMEMSFLGERIHRADNLSRVCSQCDQRTQCPKLENKEFSITNFEY